MLKIPQHTKGNVFQISPDDYDVLHFQGSRTIPSTETSTTSVEYIVDASGNGDYETISAALTALGSNPGVIKVKAGTYSISAPLEFGGNDQAIVGSSWGAVIQASETIDELIDTKGYSRMFIDNLKLDGNSKAGIGISLSGGDDSKILNCWITGVTDEGISSGGSSTRITISLCKINNCGDNGIAGTGTGWIITNNNIIDNTDTGILYVGSGGTISNNTIYGNDEYGIFLSSASKVTLTGNEIKENGSVYHNASGIYLYTTDYCTIIANNVTMSKSYGIEIYNATSDKNIIVGNTLIDNDDGATSDGGTGTIISNNIS